MDINSTTNNMLAAMQQTAGANWANIKSTATQVLQKQKGRLLQLAQLRLSGELSEAEFQSRLADQQLIVEAELEALDVMSKATTQKTANAAIDVLEKAVVKSLL